MTESCNDVRFAKVDRLMRTAVKQGVFPGAVLVINFRNAIVFQQAYGFADLFSRRPMTNDTIFDLASLTKPLATTLSTMLMVQQGRMHLDQPIVAYRPEFHGTDKSELTVRQLLSHRSGLPAWRPYYMRLRSVPKAERMSLLRSLLLRETLQSPPGTRTEYSDLGFILLQWIIEAVSGENMARLLHENVYRPLGLDRLFFVDPEIEHPACLFAATELCPWRNRLIVGSVHDDNAHMLAGVAGHAGLFGSASSVADLLMGLLSGERGCPTHPIFDRKVIETFFQRQSDDTWALGFDTPSEKNSSAGSLFSRDSIGHLGFTGTSFWMDRQKDVIVVLLSNRVHPSRYNTRIRVFRPGLHEAVISAFFCR